MIFFYYYDSTFSSSSSLSIHFSRSWPRVFFFSLFVILVCISHLLFLFCFALLQFASSQIHISVSFAKDTRFPLLAFVWQFVRNGEESVLFSCANEIKTTCTTITNGKLLRAKSLISNSIDDFILRFYAIRCHRNSLVLQILFV